MLANLKQLYSSHNLLWIWILRSIKVRYAQSLLGVAWAILQPISLMLIFSLVFTRIVRVSTEGIPYPIFAYSALLPWTFLASSISLGVPSLVSNMNLVKKIYFPREILPISVVAASLLDLIVASIVFFGMMLAYGFRLQVTALMLPVLLAIQILLVLGVVLFASAVNVFYRDIRFVVPLGVQLWMYASPIIYPISLVPERLHSVYRLNPMATLIEAYRDVMLQGQWPDWVDLWTAAAVSALIFAIGYLAFKRMEWKFADVI